MTPFEIRESGRKVARLSSAGRHTEAIVEARNTLSRMRIALPAGDLRIAVQLQLLASCLNAAGEWANALASTEEALAIRIPTLGDSHPSIAVLLREKSIALFNDSRGQEAIDAYRRARKIWTRSFAPDHEFLVRAKTELRDLENAVSGKSTVVADALAAYDLGLALRKKHDYPGARREFEKALRLNREQLGLDHPDVASCLNALGALLRDLGKLEDSAAVLREALYITHRNRRANPRDYTHALSELAYTLRLNGNFEEATEFCELLLPIADRSSDDDLEQAATIYNNYGALLRTLGRGKEALEMFSRAALVLQGHENDSEQLRDLTAVTRSNHASLLSESGDYKSSILLAREALEEKAALYGREHPSYARTLQNLAASYSNAGDSEHAHALTLEAVGILRKVFPAGHQSLAQALLEASQCTTGDERQALATEALEILQSLPEVSDALIEKARLNASPTNELASMESRARAMARLGERIPMENIEAIDTSVIAGTAILMRQLREAPKVNRDAIEEAATFLRRAETALKARGDRSTELAHCLNQLALAEAALGSFGKAMRLSEEAMHALLDRTERIFAAASARIRLEHTHELEIAMSGFLSLLLSMPADPSMLRRCASILLRSKNLGADLAMGESVAYGLSSDPWNRDLLHELIAVKSRLVERIIEGPGVSAKHMEHDIRELNRTRDRLEGELSLHSDLSGQFEAMRRVSLESLQEKLQPSDVLIDFFLFSDLRALWDTTNHERPEHTYAALVVRPTGPPQLIDLGPASTLGPWIEKCLEAFSSLPSTNRPNPIAELYGRKLRAAILAPLRDATEGCTQWYVAPDGALWSLPLETLPLEDGRALIDAVNVTYLSLARDLVRTHRRYASGQAAVFADPDFDLMAAAGAQADEDWVTQIEEELGEEGLQLAVQITLTGPVAPEDDPGLHERLPESRIEGESVAQQIGATRYFGPDAHKAALRNLRSPRVLHLATHGFFHASEVAWSEINARRLLGARQWNMAENFAFMSHLQRRLQNYLAHLDGSASHRTNSDTDNPMLRSGLLLAGSNTWLRRGKPHPDAGNGHVTAEEIALLDLTGTRLVVLSCCESAKGGTLAQAGIFGLRHAFVLAGAQVLVMTAWKVRDAEARMLINYFYSFLAQGQSPGVALQNAKQELRKTHPHPFYWGAFICQGANAHHGRTPLWEPD